MKSLYRFLIPVMVEAHSMPAKVNFHLKNQYHIETPKWYIHRARVHMWKHDSSTTLRSWRISHMIKLSHPDITFIINAPKWVSVGVHQSGCELWFDVNFWSLLTAGGKRRGEGSGVTWPVTWLPPLLFPVKVIRDSEREYEERIAVAETRCDLDQWPTIDLISPHFVICFCKLTKHSTVKCFRKAGKRQVEFCFTGSK